MTDTETIAPSDSETQLVRYGGLEADDTWLCEDIAWEITKLEVSDLPDCEPPPSGMFAPTSHVIQLLEQHPRAYAGYAESDWKSLSDATSSAGAASLASLIKAIKANRASRFMSPTEIATDARTDDIPSNLDQLDIRELAGLLRGTAAEERARTLLLFLFRTI